MSVPVLISIECGMPMHEYEGQDALVREASLCIAGVPVFTEVVYDTNRDGDRTEQRAAENLMLTLRHVLDKAKERSN